MCYLRHAVRLLCSAFLYGDPHFVTFDNANYTFNGLGEYVLAQTVPSSSSTFTIQCRTASAGSGSGATVLVAFAMQLNGGDVVELDYNPIANAINIFVNGHNITDDMLSHNESTSTSELESEPANGGPPYDVSVENGSVTVTYNIGLSIKVSVGYLSLSTQFSLPSDFSALFTGLLGNLDGDPLNDYVMRNGTMLAANSSQAQLYQFGQSCMRSYLEII
jgi:hypothetical protein